MAHTRAEIIRTITEDYLAKLNMANPPTPEDIQDDLLTILDTRLEIDNGMRNKGNKFRYVHELLPAQIAMILVKLYPIVRVSSGMHDSDYDVLAMYMPDGDDAGIYVTDSKHFHNLIRKYNFSINEKGVEETLFILHDIAPCVTRCCDKNLIAVNNGIFDYETKQLLPFTPDKVFLSKSKVDYNPNAVNPVITEPDGSLWDIESWMQELTDDPEITDLLWCIIGAVIRPNQPYGLVFHGLFGMFRF